MANIGSCGDVWELALLVADARKSVTGVKCRDVIWRLRKLVFKRRSISSKSPNHCLPTFVSENWGAIAQSTGVFSLMISVTRSTPRRLARSDYYMNLEISNEPFRVTLSGYGGPVKDGNVRALGKRLMDRMWSELPSHQVATMGINQWVYLPNSMIFIGVKLVDPFSNVGALEQKVVSLDRYLKHLHVGPYATLLQIWLQLSRN